MARVASVADVQVLLGVGMPGIIVIEAAGSVRDARVMKDLLIPALQNGAAVVRVKLLDMVARLADNLVKLADVFIPGLTNNPADAHLLRLLDDTGKLVRTVGKELRGRGVNLRVQGAEQVPHDAGAMAVTLANKIHKMVSHGFNFRGSGLPRPEAERGAFVAERLVNLRDHVIQVLDNARVSF